MGVLEQTLCQYQGEYFSNDKIWERKEQLD
jgi:hypothetical protein